MFYFYSCAFLCFFMSFNYYTLRGYIMCIPEEKSKYAMSLHNPLCVIVVLCAVFYFKILLHSPTSSAWEAEVSVGVGRHISRDVIKDVSHVKHIENIHYQNIIEANNHLKNMLFNAKGFRVWYTASCIFQVLL